MKFTEMTIKHKGKDIPTTILVMGSKDGFLKMVSFGKLPKIEPFQLDCKSIIDMKIPERDKFGGKNLCFALMEDNKIFIVDLHLKAVIGHFHPIIMMC